MDADSKKSQQPSPRSTSVEDGMTIGVGTGSTVNHFIAALRDRRNRIAGAVSSSEASTRLLQEAGIEVPLAQRHQRPLALRGRAPTRRPVHLALDQGRRRRVDARKDRGGGQSPLSSASWTTYEGRGRARAISLPSRSSPWRSCSHGRAQARRHQGATRPAHGFQDRQRQRDPRRAQPEDHGPVSASRPQIGLTGRCRRGRPVSPDAGRTFCWSPGMTGSALCGADPLPRR